MNVKDKKIIVYKNEQVKKFAYNLRNLVTEVVMDKWSRLGKEQTSIRLDSER